MVHFTPGDQRVPLPSSSVQVVLQDRLGFVWLGFFSSGLGRYDGHSLELYGRADGIPDATVRELVEDSAGRLWVGTAGEGVARYRIGEGDRLELAHFGRGASEVRSPLSALTVRRDGSVWVAREDGSLAVLKPGAPRLAPISVGRPPDAAVTAFHEGPDRTLWLGCRDGSLWRLDEAANRFTSVERSLTEQVSAILQTRSGELWAGTGGGLAAIRPDAGESSRIMPAQGLLSGSVYALARDPEGRLWLGTRANGLFRSRDPVTLERLRSLVAAGGGRSGREVREPLLVRWWSRERGARSDSALDLEWAGGLMWVATGVGLEAVEGDSPRAAILLDRDNGLGGDRVVGVALSPVTGSLWVAQSHGLAEVDPTGKVVLRTVSARDGLLDNEAWQGGSVAVGADGAVYLATPEGLCVYRPALDRRSSVAPLVALRAAEVSEDRWGNNQALFQYAALSFTGEQEVRFRTRLRGYDPAWSPPSAEHRIRYTNLPAFFLPRRYVLEVTAASAEGVWAESPLRHELEVHPAWWLRWWAVVVWAVALAGAVWAFITVRTVRLSRRARILEELVAEHTGEIRGHLRELETLDRIVEIINREIALDRVMEAVLRHGLVLVPEARRALLLFRDPDRGRFEIAATTSERGGLASGLSVSVQDALRRYTEEGEALAPGVFLLRQPVDGSGAHIFGGGPPASALLSLDLPLGGKVEGLPLFELTTSSALVSYDLRTLQRYREHAISALDKARVVRELEQKSREAAQASAAKSAFLATVSHELRTPLNSIIGFSEILLDKLELAEAPRYRRFLQNVLASGRHLLSLINDILDLAKVEAGKVTLEHHPIVVPELVEGVCRIMMAVAAKPGVDLVQDVQADLAPVVGDASKLKQILYNLLSNAVKFSTEGGTVSVSVRIRPADSSPLGVETLELAVRDEGIGIAAEDQERIFEEFRQLDAGLGRGVVGTGLGLTLTRRFVELQGGRITVESTPGQGSTFRVFLPTMPG